MLEGLVALLIAILVIGIVAAIIIYLIRMLPIDPKFKQIGEIVVMLIAVLLILIRALPLLGVTSI